ncbi:DUF6089 family protein [Mesonia aestuariivivens]|uniref:DUF6089 domain-containing protein n=1 Tax=Mesonia aestuariivivens TaxID=2796128 RepID=A0ABS6W3J1_9FLAO|nr:DUF6089 family protein [Mesonia aestuariivivens]MBW2962415.1 hypothetical protein [Mesonia aestuariivivens]
MRYLTAVIIMVLLNNTLEAQTYEIGVMFGGINYIGDVGKTNYISPNKLAIGGIAKWNRSDRHSFRASLLYTQLSANDADSDEARRKQRGYSFDNSMIEGSLGLEFTFKEWNLHTFKKQFTPYLYTGITGFLAHDMGLNSNGEISTQKRKLDFAIPMVFGAKYTLTTDLILAAEIGARYTFTDNLDGSNPEEFDDGKNLTSFGNPNTNDWYMFTGITLTYTFGRKPCYCNF